MSVFTSIDVIGSRISRDPNDDANLFINGADNIKHSTVTEQNSSTGLLCGGEITLNVNNYNISMGKGIIIVYSPEDPLVLSVTSSSTRPLTPATITVSDVSPFSVGNIITVSGLDNPADDGQYTISDINGNVITLSDPFTDVIVSNQNNSGGTVTLGQSAGCFKRNQVKVSWDALGPFNILPDATNPTKYIYLEFNSDGTLVNNEIRVENSYVNNLSRERCILLGYIKYYSYEDSGTQVIYKIFNSPNYIGESSANLIDLVRVFNLINEEGNIPMVSGANTFLKITPGRIFGIGINFTSLDGFKNPNELSTSGFDSGNGDTFNYVRSDGTFEFVSLPTPTFEFTQIQPTLYEDMSSPGTTTTVPSNRWTIQTIYIDINGNIYIQFGQVTYRNSNSAIKALEDPISTPNILISDLKLGYLIIKESATDLSNSREAIFKSIVKGNIVPITQISNGPTYFVARLGTGAGNDSIIIESSPSFSTTGAGGGAVVNGSPVNGVITAFTEPSTITITDSSGLVIGQTIYVAGSTSNDGKYIISGLNGNDVIIKEAELVTIQATNGFLSDTNVPLNGSILSITGSTLPITQGTFTVSDATGLNAGDTIEVVGTDGGLNDSTFTIFSIASNIITVNEATSVQLTPGGYLTFTKSGSIATFDSSTQLTLSTTTSLVSGDTIVVTGGPADNNGIYEVDTVATNGTVITIVQLPTFTVEAGTGTVTNSGNPIADGTISDFPSSVEVVVADADGVAVGDTITITGSTSNDGSYTVKSTVIGNDRFAGTPVGYAFNQPVSIGWNYVINQSNWGLTVDTPGDYTQFNIPKTGLYQINYEFNWTTTLDVLERINVYIKKNSETKQYGDNIIATTVDAQSARITGSAAIFFDAGDTFEIVFRILSATGLLTNVALGAIVGSAVAPALLDPVLLPLVYGISGAVPVLGDSVLSPTLNLVTNEALNIGGTGPNGENYEPAGEEGGASSNSGAGYRGTPEDLFMEVSAHFVG